MLRGESMVKNTTITPLLFMALMSSASADPLPAHRRTDWSYAGVPGGIPARSTICATFSPGASAAAINGAIASCNDGAVYLNAGTYTAASLGGVIKVGRSNVTLRGAGADKTILTGGNIVNVGSGGNAALGTPITGASKGARQFTAANTANLAVGTMIEIDREDDPALVVGPTGGGKRNITQVNVITAISGSTVTVRNPMIYDFSLGSPKIKYYFPGVPKNSGVENLKLDHSGFSGVGVNFWYCDSCWIKGVQSAVSTGYHFLMLGTVNAELRDSYIHEGGSGPNNSGFNFYGNYLYGGNSNAKIENNIFNKDFPAIELNQSSSGFVVSYNYSHGTPSQNGAKLVTWTFDDGHAPFNIMNLYEGNIGEMFGADNYYGGSGHGTALRNYFTGYNPNYGVSSEAVWLDRLAYNYSLIGNVLGSANQRPTGYLGCGVSAIYRLGYPNLGNCSTAPWDGYTVAGGYPDRKVTSTLLRWGNYDYFNRAARFSASEMPADAPAPADQTIPGSYAYAKKPAWWSANVPWPAIGPDVTGGNGDASGHVYKIPAQLCWEASNLVAGGYFNAATCYPTAGGTEPPPPPPPPPPAPAPTITSSLSASGDAGQPFNYAITATNSPTSYNASGLPSGLSVNTATGLISGTPSSAGTPSTSGVALKATNGSGTGSATLILTINNPSAVPSVLLGIKTIQPILDSISKGTAEAFQTTAVASGTVNVLSIYVDPSSTARRMVAGLYTDAGGHPGALIAQGTSAALRPGAWNEVTIPGAPVVAGGKYWLAILGRRGALAFRDGSGCESETSRQSSLTTLPAVWSTGAVWYTCNLSGFGRSGPAL